MYGSVIIIITRFFVKISKKFPSYVNIKFIIIYLVFNFGLFIYYINCSYFYSLTQ